MFAEAICTLNRLLDMSVCSMLDPSVLD